MRVPLGSHLKDVLLAMVSWASGRHAVLLPREARREELLLDLRSPYQVDGSRLSVELRAPGPGHLSATLMGYAGHFPTHIIWSGEARTYLGPCALVLELTTGAVLLAGHEWGRVRVPLPGRRFCWRLALTGTDGLRRTRLTGHYVSGKGTAVGANYFEGENYVDYEAQSSGGHRQIVALLERHHGRGPVLEVGCATGGLLAALDAAGLRSVGVDTSPWAVDRTAERLGRGRAWLCDIERDPLPAEVTVESPFGALVLASVFEHFNDPFGALAKLTAVAAPGALLVITTTNADGLTHALYGPQWEGYFDWTHAGIDRVSAGTLRHELPRLGWCIAEFATHGVWDSSPDPTRATVREWWAADARFRRLLTDRDLGDLITCVAVKG